MKGGLTAPRNSGQAEQIVDVALASMKGGLTAPRNTDSSLRCPLQLFASMKGGLTAPRNDNLWEPATWLKALQ